MSEKDLWVEQVLDTQIEVRASPAFSRVAFRFPQKGGGYAVVELDMEAAVAVMEHMDNGVIVNATMSGAIRKARRRKWIDRIWALLAP